MEESQVIQYVQAAAVAVGRPRCGARAQAVAQHLGRTVALARLLETAPLAPGRRAAEIHRPVPFPTEDAA
jgi:hypothetical protein